MHPEPNSSQCAWTNSIRHIGASRHLGSLKGETNSRSLANVGEIGHPDHIRGLRRGAIDQIGRDWIGMTRSGRVDEMPFELT